MLRRVDKILAFAMTFVVVSSMLSVLVLPVRAPYGWDRYHRYTEIVAGLEDLGSSDVAHVETIGETYHEIEIKTIKISDTAHVDEMGEPDILFVGLHHAREWISAEVPYYLAVNLVQRYATDPALKALVDNCEIWVVPVLNPDGYWWTWEHDRYWRKNTRPNGDGTYGVDLNRNYGFMWGQDLDPDTTTDGSPNPGDYTYWGPNPFSEEETSAIQDLLTDPQHNFEAVLSYHSYGQLILYPWGYTEDPAPASSLMSTLATEMAELIYAVHGEVYTPMQAAQLYLVSGDLADWVYETLEIPAFTIELRPESADPWWSGFELPESEILETCEENWAAALFLIAHVSGLGGDDLGLEGVRTWHWGDDTEINEVAMGDVDGDGQIEIVTGGYYDDGMRDVAQLAVWNGASLALEAVTTWYWVDDTRITSVAVADVDGDGAMEVVTGGWYTSVTYACAQLVVWDGATLTLAGVKTWQWVHTGVSKVVVGDVDGDGQKEIVTGGNYFDGTWHIQLCVWDSATLMLEDVTAWHWVGHTFLGSMAVRDVDGDGQAEIVTGGYYHDGTRNRAQLCVWDGATLTLESVTTWYWTSSTYLFSVAVRDVDGDGQAEIVTGGDYHDGTRHWAQLCVWDGSLGLEDSRTWYWSDHTRIYSVAVGDVDGDGQLEIVTGGKYDDGTRWRAQLGVWGFT